MCKVMETLRTQLSFPHAPHHIITFDKMVTQYRKHVD